MKTPLSSLPRELAAALIVLSGFILFLIWDQSYWWRTKEDYAFGYIVPLFVIYVVYDRWPQLRALLGRANPVRPPRWMRKLGSIKAGFGLAGGLILFSMGALYRAGSGTSQPGSMAMSLGFAAIALTLIYLSVPEAEAPQQTTAAGLGDAIRASMRETRMQVALLFVFPAFVWVVSAPLVSAIEHSLSLFLLNKVTATVFFVFDMLGLPLERHGNVLAFPKGEVGVAEACSGIRSLTGSIFAGSFLGAVFLDKFWKKVALVASAMVLAFVSNIVRSIFLTSWAYNYGSEAIEGTVHDITGYAVLGLTTIGLLLLIPIFTFRWEKWIAPEEVELPEGDA